MRALLWRAWTSLIGADLRFGQLTMLGLDIRADMKTAVC